jgi:hypothetical protein
MNYFDHFNEEDKQGSTYQSNQVPKRVCPVLQRWNKSTSKRTERSKAS